ncbi:MAG: hypothetical protein K2K57_12110 [Oscillospiraceae bacterium]|nr:hypothetical protein [Oscillospiraceae bacterium]
MDEIDKRGKIDMTVCSCPMCWDNISAREKERFGMCRECFIDEICGRVTDDVLREFLKEYRYELTGFVEDNYCEWGV